MKVLLGVILILLVGCSVPMESGQNGPAKDAEPVLSGVEGADTITGATLTPVHVFHGDPAELEEINRRIGQLGFPPMVLADDVDLPAETGTDAQIAVLTKRVAELEDQLNEVEAILQERIEDVRREQQWTENDAIVFTKYKFWERASSCNRDDCYRDPVLRGFSDKLANLPARLRDTAMEMVTDALILTEHQWSAVHEPEKRRWRVEALLEGSENSLAFYAYERAGIVEAEVPSTE